jgi:hypothetical protein
MKGHLMTTYARAVITRALAIAIVFILGILYARAQYNPYGQQLRDMQRWQREQNYLDQIYRDDPYSNRALEQWQERQRENEREYNAERRHRELLDEMRRQRED